MIPDFAVVIISMITLSIVFFIPDKISNKKKRVETNIQEKGGQVVIKTLLLTLFMVFLLSTIVYMLKHHLALLNLIFIGVGTALGFIVLNRVTKFIIGEKKAEVVRPILILISLLLSSLWYVAPSYITYNLYGFISILGVLIKVNEENISRDNLIAWIAASVIYDLYFMFISGTQNTAVDNSLPLVFHIPTVSDGAIPRWMVGTADFIWPGTIILKAIENNLGPATILAWLAAMIIGISISFTLYIPIPLLIINVPVTTIALFASLKKRKLKLI
ncbi:hypothetical protein ACFL15_01950 [Patescibacteria group bacterium]